MELLAKHVLDPKGSNFCQSNGATEGHKVIIDYLAYFVCVLVFQNPNPNCNLIFIPIGS